MATVLEDNVARDGIARVVLSPEYLRRVEKLEQLPEMQSGSDKSWVDRACREWTAHYAATRPKAR